MRKINRAFTSRPLEGAGLQCSNIARVWVCVSVREREMNGLDGRQITKKNFIPFFIHRLKKNRRPADNDDEPSGSNTSDSATTRPSLGQQNIFTASFSTSKHKSDTKEQRTKTDTIARTIGQTGLPVTTIEDKGFLEMIEIVDGRLAVPKKTKKAIWLRQRMRVRDKDSNGDWLLCAKCRFASTSGQKKDREPRSWLYVLATLCWTK